MGNLTFKIRRATTDRELEQVLALDTLVIGKEGGAKKAIDPEEGFVWWLAWQGETPVGYCGLQIDKYGAYMDRAGVIPLARGNRLQKRFLTVRERYAKKQGMTRCYTYIATWNVRSMNSLIAMGYKTYNPEWRWAEPVEAIYFYKELR